MQYIPKNQFSNVKYVGMDINPTYRDFTYHHFIGCIVMTDSFHVIKNINVALRNFRIRIMNKYERTSKEYYLLKHYTQLVAMNINEFKDVVSLL